MSNIEHPNHYNRAGAEKNGEEDIKKSDWYVNYHSPKGMWLVKAAS